MKKLISIILVLSMILLYNVNNFQQIKDYIVDELEDKQISDNKVDINQIYNFKRINIGDSKESVIEKLSNPNRIDKTPYNFFWYVYNTYKESFVMVGIKNNKVVALFTNNIDSCENENIYINKDINYIKEHYKTLEYQLKGNIRYEITSNNEYDIIYKNKKYITVFYDKYNDNKIWAYEIVEKLSEDEINEILGINSEIEIKELKDTEISDENSVTAEV